MDDPSRVIWWSGTEEQFGQVFRLDRADYKTMGWSAEQRSRQTDFDFINEDIDCFAATNLDHLLHSFPFGFQNLL